MRVRTVLGRSAVAESMEGVEKHKPRVIVVEDVRLPRVSTGPPDALNEILAREYERKLRVVLAQKGTTVDVYARTAP